MATNYTRFSVTLYKSKTYKNGEHPIAIRVNRNNLYKHYFFDLTCSVKEWSKKDNLPVRSHPHRELYKKIINDKLEKFENALVSLKAEGKDFTLDYLFEKATIVNKQTTVFNFFEQKIEQLKDLNQLSNSDIYKGTYNKIRTYQKEQDITFSQVDYNYLLKFENYLKKEGLSDNGISLRMRTIRALFNTAIDENYTAKENYPFDKFKISERYNTKTLKRAITKEEKEKIEVLSFDKSSADFEAQQYFLFSYYGQGINFVDIAHLRWKDIVNGRIYYKRAKTEGLINFKLTEPSIKIIEYWRVVKTPSQDEYIFPILNKQRHITSLQQHNRIHKVLTRVNKSLKKIGELAGINTSLTTYVARHTFATVLKRSGVSTSIISESMGHQTEAITQTYLKSFENSVIDDAMENLL